MDHDQKCIDDTVIDLGSVTAETKGAGFVQLDTAGTQLIPMAMSED